MLFCRQEAIAKVSSLPRASCTKPAWSARLNICLFIHVREVCTRLICIPGKYSTTTRLHTTTNHVNSRMLPGVTRMKCVSTVTPREDSDRSVCATHCEQRLQLREQKTLTETSPEVTRSADARLSCTRVAFKLCVVVKWSGYVQQGSGVGTGVQLLTVEQEWLLLEADVKHSEVQNLFSLLNAVVTCFQCLKRVSAATELTSS